MNRIIHHSFLVFHFSLLMLLAGCFNEPVPATKTAPAGARVYLQDKGLKAFPEDAITNAAVVDYVNLDRNAFEKFPEKVLSCPNLKWLRLNDNKLAALPDLKALANLRRIYLRNNRLTAVPETLKELPALTDVDLSGNMISTVPDWLAAKKGLENLSFSRTLVTKLPENLDAWKSLKSLQLGELRIPSAEMARIRAALPAVAIVY